MANTARMRCWNSWKVAERTMNDDRWICLFGAAVLFGWSVFLISMIVDQHSHAIIIEDYKNAGIATCELKGKTVPVRWRVSLEYWPGDDLWVGRVQYELQQGYTFARIPGRPLGFHGNGVYTHASVVSNNSRPHNVSLEIRQDGCRAPVTVPAWRKIDQQNGQVNVHIDRLPGRR